MELVCGAYGGVCDRLANALFAYKAASATHRTVCFHWSVDSGCNCSFEKLFKTEKLLVSQAARKDGVPLHGTISSVIKQLRGMEAIDVVNLGNAYRGHDFDALDEVFSPSDLVQERVLAFKSERWRDSMIGVHVRRTDKKCLGVCPTNERYMDAIDVLLEMLPSANIFLAGDESNCEAPFRSRYGDRLHHYPVRSLNRSCESAIVDAVTTLYLLRATTIVIGGSYSGFSLCAGWHNGFVDLAAKSHHNRDWENRSLQLPKRPQTSHLLHATMVQKIRNDSMTTSRPKIALECCILVLCDRDNPVTQEHLKLLRALNTYPVVAISRDRSRPVPYGVGLDLSVENELERDSPHSSTDLFVYAWFRRRGFDAARYVILEWDTLATMPLRDFYADVWHEHVVAANVFLSERGHTWDWFHQIGRLPQDLKPHATGLMPISGIMLSHQAMTDLVYGKPIPKNVFCELRIGSLLRAHGYNPTSLAPTGRDMISWNENLIKLQPKQPGIYHPVTRLVELPDSIRSATSSEPRSAPGLRVSYPSEFCMKALVINADDDTARLKNTTVRTAAVGLAFERVPAKLIADRRLGCRLSHIRCVEIAKSRGWPELIVMEDDVIFRDWDLFPLALAELAKVAWDMFFPYDWYNKADRRPSEIKLVKSQGTICRHFMMIHSRFYDGFLERHRGYTGANDRAFLDQPQVRQYVTSYNLAGQDRGRSLITSEDKDVRWHA